MADTHALGACAARREGSTPFSRTTNRTLFYIILFSKNFPCHDHNTLVI